MTLVLLLFLALTASWTGLVQCEDQEGVEDAFLEVTTSVTAGGKDPENHVDVTGSGDETNQEGEILNLNTSPVTHNEWGPRLSDVNILPNISIFAQINESHTEHRDNEDLGSTRDAGNDVETGQTTETDTETDISDLNPVLIIIIPLVLTLLIVTMIVCIYRRWRSKVVDTKEDHYLDDEDHEKVPMPMFEDDIPSVMELEMEDLENWMTKDGGMTVDTGQN